MRRSGTIGVRHGSAPPFVPSEVTVLSDGLSPELVWGLFPRLVGLLYVIAFGTLQPSFVGSSRGMHPAQNILAKVRRDYPGIRRFFEYPTLLWWVKSDQGLRMLTFAGFVCGLLAIY